MDDMGKRTEIAIRSLRRSVDAGPVLAADAIEAAAIDAGMSRGACELVFITMLNAGEIATDREMMLVPGPAAVSHHA